MKRIRDIMKKDKVVSVQLETPVTKISRMLIEHGMASIPIVNNNDELCGLISEKDIVNVADSKRLGELAAKDIMKESVEYVKDDDHVEIAVRLFSERPYNILPVVRDNLLVGIITRDDIFSSWLGEGE